MTDIKRTMKMHCIVRLVYVLMLWFYIIGGDDSSNLVKTSKPIILPESTEFAVPGLSLLHYVCCQVFSSLYYLLYSSLSVSFRSPVHL